MRHADARSVQVPDCRIFVHFGRSSSAKQGKIRQSIAHGRSADMKSFSQEGDCLFVVQVKIVLFDFLLQETPGHQECSTELIGLDLFTVNSSGGISISPKRQMTIDKEL